MEQLEENVKEHPSAPEKADRGVPADFFAIFHDVLKDLWAALLIGISVALLTYVGAYLTYHPQYVSQTTFVVSAKGSNTGAYANLSQTQRMAEVFKTVLDSDVLKKKVAERLEADSFEGEVSVNIVPETNLLSVSVTTGSPTTSFQQLNTMLEEYPSVSQNVLGDVVLEVFEEPNYPASPTAAFQGSSMMKRGFMAGAAVMIVLFALMSYFRDSVKNEKDVEKKLDTSLFATVYHERRYQNLKALLNKKKKKLWFTEPAVSFGFGETIKKIRTKLIYQQKKSGEKILLISSTAPQEGRTTLAVNLALAFAQDSKKVLLIEGDLREGSLREYLGLASSDVIKDWGSCAADCESLRGAVHYSEELGFSVMVNDERVQRSTEVISSESMGQFLEQMKREMDLILIDSPHVKGRSDAEAWARRSEMSLLVVRQNRVLAKYINDTIDVLEGYGSRLLG